MVTHENLNLFGYKTGSERLHVHTYVEGTEDL